MHAEDPPATNRIRSTPRHPGWRDRRPLPGGARQNLGPVAFAFERRAAERSQSWSAADDRSTLASVARSSLTSRSAAPRRSARTVRASQIHACQFAARQLTSTGRCGVLRLVCQHRLVAHRYAPRGPPHGRHPYVHVGPAGPRPRRPADEHGHLPHDDVVGWGSGTSAPGSITMSPRQAAGLPPIKVTPVPPPPPGVVMPGPCGVPEHAGGGAFGIGQVC